MEEGKLFVVIAVLSLILVGLAVYIFVIDKKVNRVVKKMKEENPELDL
jgi:hypothetical protein